MKKIGTTLVMALFMSVLAFAGGEKVQLKVEGMTCGGCEKGVKAAIESVEGVSGTEVSYQTGLAMVEFDGEEANVKQIIKSIKKAGYEADIATEEDLKAANAGKSGKACCAGKSSSSCGPKKAPEKKEEM